MKQFAKLIETIDQTTKSTVKVNALVEFFLSANDSDKVWAIALFTHRRPKRLVPTKLLREWAAELVDIPLWLFENTYHIVGDLAETIALLIPENSAKSTSTLSNYITKLIELRDAEPYIKKEFVLATWQELSQFERFVFNKLLTGGFRIGVSQQTIVKALAKTTQLPESTIAHKLMGNWNPETVSFTTLLSETEKANNSAPYPFFLAYAVEQNQPELLGDSQNWLAEYKWDGIRAQVIVRAGELYIWSRGEELITDKFPEFSPLPMHAQNQSFVLDGELLAFKNQPLPFHTLQTRISRKNVTQKVLENAPAALIAYDLLELNGRDLRQEPLHKRKELLQELLQKINVPYLLESEVFSFSGWTHYHQLRSNARSHMAEGLMLKHKDSTYKVGRKKGDWFKWKLNPLVIDAVLIYGMRGHGRRANLFSDYTFAVWNGEELVPFTKAYSGLTDKELKEVDAFIKKNTIDRFGPVRSVKAELVFEIAFEGIAPSSRHKSGVALRFPRINRWRTDKKAAEANTLQDLQQIMAEYNQL